MKSRTRTGKIVLPPPSTPEDGAKRIGELMVGIFDRKDGTGVDWPLMVESQFRAAFAALDRLPAETRQKIALRVHAGAYDRMTDGAESATSTDARKPAAPSVGIAFTPKAGGPT